jgi:arabinogalactan oligomer/maltooligosaccharide transport system substrate-binding protein
MLTDVEAGADVYAFAQDQLGRLVQAGALSKLGGNYLNDVKNHNDEGSVSASTVGTTVYAYPLTSDNGYFLYYDKSVVKDPSDLDAILADCKAAGKSLYMDNQSGWYLVSFFFGAGCSYTTESNDRGEIMRINCDFDSDAGLDAMKAMISAVKSGGFQRSDSFASQFNPDGGKAGAAISGTWDAAAIKSYLGENYGVAKLPTMTTASGEKQMGSWAGYKLMGVNPTQSDGAVIASHRLAAYLTGESVQLARYEAKGWGPSNRAAQENEKVKADEALSALRAQLAFAPPQPQCSANFWSKMEAFGTEINAGTYNAYSDAELRSVLRELAEYLRADVVKG